MDFFLAIKIKLQFLLLVFYLITLVGYVIGVHINDVVVPPLVRNGSLEFVLLDCDYNLEENEKAGLVVKWYLNNEESPVYQWIPLQRPQDLGLLKGRIDLNYVSSSQDEYKKYRGLKILKPTTQLSGKYICRTSTLFNDAYKSALMTVYAPEKEMGIKVSGTRVPGYVNVSCWATRVYPQPKLTLYYGENADQKIDDLVVGSVFKDGAYDIVGYKILRETNMSSITSLFECELSIPNTPYSSRKTTLYEPGSLELKDESMAGGSKSSVHISRSASAFIRVSISSLFILINNFLNGPPLPL